MFSAVISTTATRLVRIKEDEAKENEQKTPRRTSVWLPSSVPYLGIISGFFIRTLSRRPCTVLQ